MLGVHRWTLPTFGLVAYLAMTNGSAWGQAQVRDFTRPFVVLNTGGHSAPLRALIVEPGGDRILSAGMDKVVNVWALEGGRARLSRTIRPAIWRGSAGTIYAMALSPPAVAPDRRLLAVAGYGVESTGGNIALYRFPGSVEAPSGELEAMIPGSSSERAPGHSSTVTGLAFSPDGRILASAGNDGRVILWDIATRKPLATFTQPYRVNALAFRPDGRRLAAGGTDGVVRLFDVDRRVLLYEQPPTANERPKPLATTDPQGDMINCVAFSPADGRYIVIGRENGLLVRYEGDSLANPQILQRAGERRGAVEALAISHDGRLLVAAVLRDPLKQHGDLPSVACQVQIRRFPEGTLEPTRFEATNLVQALAFGPGDKWLAYGGGDDQAITLRDLTDLKKPSLVISGQGSSVWDVGFGSDNSSVGFSHSPGGGGDLIHFDLRAGALRALDKASLSRAIVSWEGWRVDPVDPLKLNISGPGGKSYPIQLDALRDRRWWAWSFLPPGPGHPRASLAIACDGGVAIVRLDDGVRTRFLAGHESAIYCLAPSPDNRWLATGSSDQTVRIWPLAHCDDLPVLGATFNREAGKAWSVVKVASRGFAEAMGMVAGDVIEILAIDGKRVDPDANLPMLNTLPPGRRIEFQVRRGADQVLVGTTRRDGPALSLFVGGDREWVVWMPQGYYETSVAGDRKYLGWHRNGATIDKPTDHFPADKFEKEFRRPQVISRLIQTADLGQALALLADPNEVPAILVERDGPPRLTLTAPLNLVLDRPFVVAANGLEVHAIASAESRSPIKSLAVYLDGRPEGALRNFAPPKALADERFPIRLNSGRQRVTVVATNEAGKERIEGFDVVAPVEAKYQPTLHVLTFATGGPFLDQRFPNIPDAASDAKDLRQFFRAPGGVARFDRVSEMPAVVGDVMTTREVRSALLKLADVKYKPSDTLIVFLETHVLFGTKDRLVIAADSVSGAQPGEGVTADELGDALGRIAENGCRVMFLIDSAHEKAPRECLVGLTEWVRGLIRRKIVVFVASNHGPSRRVLTQGHGAFAQSVLEVFDARARSRQWVDPGLPLTLDDFQDAVISRVQEYTSRKQFPACYIPETISSQILILEPNRREPPPR